MGFGEALVILAVIGAIAVTRRGRGKPAGRESTARILLSIGALVVVAWLAVAAMVRARVAAAGFAILAGVFAAGWLRSALAARKTK
jgi:hypothetical protein